MILDESLARTTVLSTILTNLEMINIAESTHSEQNENEYETTDTSEDTNSTTSEFTSTAELPRSLSGIRKLVNSWSKYYFKDYIGEGYYNRLDKNLTVFNDFQLLSIMKKQIDDKRKKVFPVHPIPPSGYKDYLLNRCTYNLAGNSKSSIVNTQMPPPADLPEQLKILFVEQEKERKTLRTQHIVEKEKLVLNVEQEILRVHGRAARALANQQFPYSLCTILADAEMCHIKDQQQLEYEDSKQEEYSSDIFLSWLHNLDDKWENIKESMLRRHHNEADSLHAVQKMFWEWKLKELPLFFKSGKIIIDEKHVPIVEVSDDFNIFYA